MNQASDEALRTIREEVLDRENRAVVAITGPPGAGKTQRLRVATAEAKERGAFVVYFDVTTRSPWVMRGLAEAIQEAARGAGFQKMLGSPAWLRAIGTLARSKGGLYNPKEAGRRIGEALNATSPSFLLLNDVHNMTEAYEADLFVKTLEEVSGVMKPGVLLMFSCYVGYLAWLTANQPAFAARINRSIPLAGLSDDEARLVLAKKLLAKRIVEELEPTYPFDREAVRELNLAAKGNPRRLFELADVALERGVATRAYQIDGELVRAALSPRDGIAPGSRAPEKEAPPPPPAEPEVAATPPARPARRSLFKRSG